MKKILALLSITVLSLFITGCAKTIELTDEESKLIAEYAAELLIKYDRNMDSKYYNDEYSDKIPIGAVSTETTEAVTTEEPTEAATTESTATDATTEAITTEEDVQDGDSSGDDQGQAGIINSNVGTTEDVSGIVADAGRDYDLATLLQESNVSIKYDYYMVLDEYPSYTQDGMFITVEAPAGYKLLVLKFKIENKTNEEQSVDLYSKDVSYRIIVDDSKSAKPMLTILIDDLYTYEASVDASMYNEAVLLFQISDTLVNDIQDLKLKAEYNGEDVIISLQ